MEWAAVAFSLLYILLAARQSVWCWLFGGLSAGVSVVLFFSVKLYAESVLYIFYVVVSFYGWWKWHHPPFSESLPVVEWPVRKHIFLAGLSLIGTLLIFWIFSTYTDAAHPFLDALTTAFSFATTYLVARKILSNWLYWVVIDALSVYLYASRGLPVYALLMAVYTGMAVYGYFQWRKDWIMDQSHKNSAQ